MGRNEGSQVSRADWLVRANAFAHSVGVLEGRVAFVGCELIVGSPASSRTDLHPPYSLDDFMWHVPVPSLLTILCAFTSSLPGQDLSELVERADVQRALEHIDAHRTETAAFLAEIGGIISPSGEEHARARAVAARMRQIGLQEVVVDEQPNVVGVLPGRSDKALVFVATLDDLATVAQNQREAAVPPRVEETRVVGPGTNTSLTSAAILAAAQALIESGIRPEYDLVFAAVAQEETGLVGMKALFAQWRDRAIAFVDVLGDGRSISYGAIGIHWWKVVARGPAGHTLGGGLPNVNQGIARAVDRILQLPHPIEARDARTRINIAQIHSGAVFNHKPATGWFSLDVRSMDGDVIEAIETEVRKVLAQVGEETGTQLEMEPFQLTPGGQIEGMEESKLVLNAAAVSRFVLGEEPRLGNSGSSNMNVAIGAGFPAIGLGGSRGGARGQPDEWADIDGMLRTAKHVLLLGLSMR